MGLRIWVNKSGIPTYNCWRAMRSRCYNKKNKDYHNYGGRGIKICDRWANNYDKFCLDMGEKPEGLTLDRIDSNGNYEPSNCKWSTSLEQANNRRNNQLISNEDKTLTISEWSRIKNICPSILHYRFKNKMSLDDIFSVKKVKPKNYNFLMDITRKSNVYIEYNGKKQTIAKWSKETGLNEDTIWHRLNTSKWSIEKSLTKSTERNWNHGTNTGYSTYKCRCKECTEFNRIKSKKARDRLKLKRND